MATSKRPLYPDCALVPGLGLLDNALGSNSVLTNENRGQGSYVSPSDDIMSPCSKKLSDLKGKRFKKCVPTPSPQRDC